MTYHHGSREESMSNRLYKPTWLYESLPYIYTVMGLVMVFFVGNIPSVFGGLALISAGVLIGMMRYTYRRSPAPVDHHEGSDSTDEATNTGYAHLVWRNSYDCGNPTINFQHRRLFAWGNELISAIYEYRPKDEILILLNKLVAHLEEHFNTENALLAETVNPLSTEHEKAHLKLLARAKDISERYEKGELFPGDLIGFISYDVILQHVVKENMLFSPDAEKAGLATGTACELPVVSTE